MVSCPGIWHDREKSVSVFFAPPQQVFKHIGKTLTETSLLQDVLSQLSSSSCVPGASGPEQSSGTPSLVTLQYVCLSSAGEPWCGPSTTDVPHQGWAATNDCLPWPCGNTLPISAWEPLLFFTAKAHFWLWTYWLSIRTPKVLQSCLPAGGTPVCTCAWWIPP